MAGYADLATVAESGGPATAKCWTPAIASSRPERHCRSVGSVARLRFNSWLLAPALYGLEPDFGVNRDQDSLLAGLGGRHDRSPASFFVIFALLSIKSACSPMRMVIGSYQIHSDHAAAPEAQGLKKKVLAHG